MFLSRLYLNMVYIYTSIGKVFNFLYRCPLPLPLPLPFPYLVFQFFSRLAEREKYLERILSFNLKNVLVNFDTQFVCLSKQGGSE